MKLVEFCDRVTLAPWSRSFPLTLLPTQHSVHRLRRCIAYRLLLDQSQLSRVLLMLADLNPDRAHLREINLQAASLGQAKYERGLPHTEQNDDPPGG